MEPLYIIGLGPGGASYLTAQAAHILRKADCLVGYSLYMELVPQEIRAGKKLIANGMRQETERCNAAIEMALHGVTTALLASGDPGIYAMASLVIELLEKRNLANVLPLDIVPGIPAMCAAAALLGAPLGHDFACISLSDALTPWRVIEKRLIGALDADFVCVLYNPRSHARPDYLKRALELARERRAGNCPVGLARNVGRDGQAHGLYSLAGFDDSLADMLSIVVIGNSESRICGSYFLTPRGYAKKRI